MAEQKQMHTHANGTDVGTGCEDGRKMRPPSLLVILLYVTLSRSLKVVSKRGSAQGKSSWIPSYITASPSLSSITACVKSNYLKASYLFCNVHFNIHQQMDCSMSVIPGALLA
ncbi:hypothetical protein PAMP_003614 [Pampus punctatissimus]